MRRLRSVGISACSSTGGKIPCGESRDKRGGEGVCKNGGRSQHKKGRENSLRIRSSRKHLQNLADAGLRTKQLRDCFESPRARKRDAEAAEDFWHGCRDQDVSQHLVLARAERQRGILVDWIEIERSALSGDIQNDDDIEGDETDCARPSDAEPDKQERRGDEDRDRSSCHHDRVYRRPHEPDAGGEKAERYADRRAEQNGDSDVLGGVEEIGEQTWIFDAIIG